MISDSETVKRYCWGFWGFEVQEHKKTLYLVWIQFWPCFKQRSGLETSWKSFPIWITMWTGCLW